MGTVPKGARYLFGYDLIEAAVVPPREHLQSLLRAACE